MQDNRTEQKPSTTEPGISQAPPTSNLKTDTSNRVADTNRTTRISQPKPASSTPLSGNNGAPNAPNSNDGNGQTPTPEQSAQPQTPTIDLNGTYPIKVNGRIQQVTGEQLLNGYNRGVNYSRIQSDYDRSQQQMETVIQRNRELEQRLLDHEREQLKQSFRRPVTDNRQTESQSNDYSWLTDSTTEPDSNANQQPQGSYQQHNQQQQPQTPYERLVDTVYQSGIRNESDIRSIIREELNNFNNTQTQQQQIERQLDESMKGFATGLQERYGLPPERAVGILGQVEQAAEALRLAHNHIDPVENYNAAIELVLDKVLPELVNFHSQTEQTRVQQERDAAMLESVGGSSIDGNSGEIEGVEEMTYEEIVKSIGDRGRKRFNVLRGAGV